MDGDATRERARKALAELNFYAPDSVCLVHEDERPEALKEDVEVIRALLFKVRLDGYKLGRAESFDTAVEEAVRVERERLVGLVHSVPVPKGDNPHGDWIDDLLVAIDTPAPPAAKACVGGRSCPGCIACS